ncbi:HAD hydrolase-like protein [Brachybacterium saurashtrense]|uniref:HAD family hydrolase n=1 Tax=Brachybacterium saurashtrense TaxID=556288 RepID=A0A345YKK7_9MICO|nr:HAD hydrolase-like protein [Brachybacterium saurashtrense]AXK44459.1 HAD family hydrolase [Brachybacterium saurashtrense]RRR23071.1 HAD family hydrolase [Brachybacterium saurashtrense]
MTSLADGALAHAPVILLDLDGTVVESAPGILAALDHAFAATGEEHPGRERLQSFIGPPLVDSFRTELGMSEERAEAMRLAYTEHYLAHGYRLSVPYEGMTALIAALRAEGRTVAVATNKPETTAVSVLEHQGLIASLDLVGGTDASTGRTHKAQVIGSVLERLGVTAAGGAVMVGDRLHDADGAAAHGLEAVLVGWGYGGEAERRAGLPFVATVPQLDRLLRR